MPFSYLDFMAEVQGRRRSDPSFEPPRLTPLRKPIAESTIGVFTSVGARLPDQPAFQVTDDLSYRLLPRTAPVRELTFDHETPVRLWAKKDLNVAYPRDRLVELEGEGAFGRLADQAVSMLGSISQFTPLIQDVVPQIKEEYDRQDVDLVLLFPF
jgi:D-proline reductase (dithiol) PrdB